MVNYVHERTSVSHKNITNRVVEDKLSQMRDKGAAGLGGAEIGQ
jgi:hypothetical protein